MTLRCHVRASLPRRATGRECLFVAVLGYGVGGCDHGGGRLTGEWLVIEGCDGPKSTRRYEPFELLLDFASIVEQEGRPLIRFANRPAPVHLTDQIVVSLGGGEDQGEMTATRDISGKTLLLGIGADREATLSLALMARCPTMTSALEAVGTITFDELGWKLGEPMVGSMRFDLVDRRTGEIVGKNFEGEFDFESETGSPFTAFSPEDY
jgi:hypothetical protein